MFTACRIPFVNNTFALFSKHELLHQQVDSIINKYVNTNSTKFLSLSLLFFKSSFDRGREKYEGMELKGGFHGG